MAMLDATLCPAWRRRMQTEQLMTSRPARNVISSRNNWSRRYSTLQGYRRRYVSCWWCTPGYLNASWVIRSRVVSLKCRREQTQDAFQMWLLRQHLEDASAACDDIFSAVWTRGASWVILRSTYSVEFCFFHSEEKHTTTALHDSLKRKALEGMHEL